MLHLVPHLVTQHTARLWLCARDMDEAQLDSISMRVNGIDVPVRPDRWFRLSAMPLHYQFIDKATLSADQLYEVTIEQAGDEQTRATFRTLPEQLGNETQPFRVLLASCYFTGNKLSRLAAPLLTQLERNGLRPNVRIWAGDQVYLDAPWYEFMIKTHSVDELKRLHGASYARTWFSEQGLGNVLSQGANVFCTDDHELWNNAPDPNTVARDTRKRNTREAWFDLGRELGRAFQGDTETARRFSVPPLDFLLLDSRVHRTENRGHLFSDAQWQELRDWVMQPRGLGVLITGQPVFDGPTRTKGNSADYHLADYTADYARLMDLLGQAARSTVVLTGDVHFSRVAWATLPSNAKSRVERRVTEFISSPLSMVAGGRLLSLLGDWFPAPAKASVPVTHPFSGTPVQTDRAFRTSAESALLLEFYLRGQRAFCTVMNWRVKDLERAQPFFRKEYFLGTIV